MQLKGKKILLGICGSIAAYKAAILTRLLVKEGANVKVIMTEAACGFISPLTLSTLSKNPVITQFYTHQNQVWNNHVDLGLWADAFIIAPASANTMAKMANGISDNVLIATYLSATCPIFIAPAMDVDMWNHPATQNNLYTLESYENFIVPVGNGELASGLIGDGRLAEPEEIIFFLKQHLPSISTKNLLDEDASKEYPLLNKNILITAGPTFEPIDPVRFIGNRSSGKMGIAIAEVSASLGANVTLLLGDTTLLPQNKNIKVISTPTAQLMYTQAIQHFPTMTAAILSAAVGDFAPLEISKQKIKKGNKKTLTLELTSTPDILDALGKQKQTHQVLVGFALETNNEIENAQKKLTNKNLDFIVLNSLNNRGAGFKHDTNKVNILLKNGEILDFDLKLKTEVAQDIIELLIKEIKNKTPEKQ